MKYSSFVLILVFFGASCSDSSDSELIDLSTFNLKPNALHEGEIVEVIYSTVGNNTEEIPNYYYPCVVVSLESGDTINVFMPFQSGFTEDNLIRAFNSRTSSSYNTVIESLRAEGLIDNESEYTKVAIPVEDQSFVNPMRTSTIGILGQVKLRDEGAQD